MVQQIEEQTPSTNEPMLDKVTSILAIKGKRFDVALISLGAFLVFSIGLIIIIDMGISVLMYWLASSIAGLNPIASNDFAFIMRLLAIMILIMSLWIGALGKPLYEKRPGALMIFILKLCFVLLVFVAFSIGIAFILAFVIFLWSPTKLMKLNERTISIYRMAIAGSIGLWLVLEMFLTADIIGTNLIPQILSQPGALFLNSIGASSISLIAAIIILPLYSFIPRFIGIIWGLREGIESFWKEFVHHRMGVVGFLIIAVIILLAVLAPFIAPYPWDYISTNQATWSQPPSWDHPLGTNHEGGDILSRMIWGTQISLIVGLTASIVAVVVGTLVGLISGYYGGVADSILMRITDIFLCLPTLPLMLIFLMMFGTGLQNVIIVIALLGWTGTARMVRSEALSLRERPLTEAAHAIGASDKYILFKHILPNTLPLILANVVIGVVGAILSEAGISFLGFMPIHGQPSWGIILYWAFRKAAIINGMWWWIVPPGLMIMLTSVGFAFISHAADSVVNPRLRGRRG
ncbi:MAG: ABC transporter permease [Candidatus Thorarchaeota archaeon]